MLRVGSTARQASFIGRRFFSATAATNDAYDVVIVGGGPGGYVAAIKAAQLGLKTACVEKRGSLGGTCLNVGCIPSKALLHSSHLFEHTKHLSDYGVKVDGVGLDLPKMMSAKDKSVTGLTSGIEMLFRKNKVDYVKGFGKMKAANVVGVDLTEGGETTLEAKNVVIATGSEVTPLPPVPVDNEAGLIVDSTGALSLSKVPERMVVIGGGIIGLELGSVWRRLGAEVHVVEFLDRICPGVDGEVAKQFQRILAKQGMKFNLGTKVTGSEVSDGSVRLTMEPVKGGDASTIDADAVLVATGRRPLTSGMGLEEIGVKLDARGMIQTDGHLRTGVPGVWAIGDCIDGPMLAHKAEEEGIAVAETIAGGAGHVNYDAIPGVVYTYPEVAWVGKNEEELKAAGIKYRKGVFPFQANSRARTVLETEGMVKFLSDAETDRILGIHIIGSNAGEMIAEGVLAVEYGASCEDIGRTSHAHPVRHVPAPPPPRH